MFRDACDNERTKFRAMLRIHLAVSSVETIWFVGIAMVTVYSKVSCDIAHTWNVHQWLQEALPWLNTYDATDINLHGDPMTLISWQVSADTFEWMIYLSNTTVINPLGFKHFMKRACHYTPDEHQDVAQRHTPMHSSNIRPPKINTCLSMHGSNASSTAREASLRLKAERMRELLARRIRCATVCHRADSQRLRSIIIANDHSA